MLSVFHNHFGTYVSDRIYDAWAYDDAVYNRSGADINRGFLSSDHGDHLSVLEHNRDVYCSASKRWKSDSMYGLKYIGIYPECAAECGIYLWIVWSSANGGNRSCDCDSSVTVSRTGSVCGCFCFQQGCETEPCIHVCQNQALYTDFIKMSLPALGNDVSWSVAFSMYSVILGHLGTDAVAANSIVSVVRNIGTVFCFSVASAGSILLGSMMGKGDLEKSKLHASKTLKATVIAGAVGGMIVLAVTPFVLEFATLNDKAMHYLKYMLFINAYYIMGAAVNSVLIAGVFRAGGDTKFGLVCDTIDMWLYAVPLGFIAAFILKLPVMWVYFLLCTDEFAKWPWVIHHYRSGKWAQNITREDVFAEKLYS